jgi:hypothetical protein
VYLADTGSKVWNLSDILLYSCNGYFPHAVDKEGELLLIFLKMSYRIYFFSLILLGILFSYSCSKDSAFNTPNGLIKSRSGFTMPTVQNGILKFTDKDHLHEYIDSFLSLDDDLRDSIEGVLGFTSLYSVILDVNDEEVIIPQNTADVIINGYEVYVKDCPYQIVFNQYNELWVGDDIYKYVGDNLLVTAKSAYVSEIVDIRNNNGIERDHTTLIDEVKDSVIVTSRTRCEMIISEPIAPTGTYGNVGYLKITLKNADGNIFTGSCGGKLTIDWGDGNTTYISENTSNVQDWRSHNYDPPGLGECEYFTVKVKLELTSNSICGFYNSCTQGFGDLVFEEEMVIKICNPHTCTPVEDEQPEIQISNNVYNSGNNRATFHLGYDLEDNWFKEPKAWGRIIHYNKNGSSWKKSKPNHKLQMRIHGSAYEGDCEESSEREKDKTGSNKTKDLKFEINLDGTGSLNDYHLRTDNRLYINWQVYHLSSSTALPETLNYPFY